MLNMRVCSEGQLSQEIGDKKIVCFGAGRNFRIFLNAHKDIQDKIICVLDNNESLNGKPAENFPVWSVNQFIRKNIKEFVLIITSVNYACEMVSQLDALDAFDGIESYINIWNYSYNAKHEIEFVKGEQKIPKIIHYGWFGKNPIPKHLQAYMDSWKKFCPDYQIIRWDESNYDVSKNRYIKQAYEAQKYAFVSDYMRLDVVKEYGGIYLDTDVELLKSLDDFLSYDFYCGFEFPYIAFGLGYGARRGHPLLNRLLQPYEDIDFVCDGVFNETPCVVYNSLVLEEEGFSLSDVYQMKDGIAVFPMEILSPGGRLCLPGRRSKNSYSIHHYEGSWVQKKVNSARKQVWEKLLNLYRERIGDIAAE